MDALHSLLARGDPVNGLTPLVDGSLGFPYGTLRSAYVILYIQLILWWLTYLIESIYKMIASAKEAVPQPGMEKGAEWLEAPTWGDYFAAATRAIRDGFLLFLASVMITQTGYGADGTAIGVLWTAFALWALWSLTKLGVDSGMVDFAFTFVMGALLIAVFGLSFRSGGVVG